MSDREDQHKQMLDASLSPRRTVTLRATTKHKALQELIDLVGKDAPVRIDPQAVLDEVLEREESFSTQLAPRVAIPHARVDALDTPLIAVGRSRKGIRWNGGDEEPVHLVILILGTGKVHLQVLSSIAIRLSNPQLYRELLAAKDSRRVYTLLTAPYPLAATPRPVLRDYSTTCFGHALNMAREMGITTVILHADAVGDITFLDHARLAGLTLMVVTRDLSRYPECAAVDRFLSVPFRGLNRSSQMDVAFLFLVSQGILARGERIISICGLPESGMLDTIMVTNLTEEYHHFFPDGDEHAPPADIEPQVLSRVLQVASSLADEGREGKPVGTMFILGDYDRVKGYCRQMIINPFRGYKEDDLNILDPALEETVKEFSRIDGAFVLRGDGVMVSVGTYIRSDARIDELTPGLGARHAAAALLSKQTGALAIVLSESTRKVSLYRRGERILQL